MDSIEDPWQQTTSQLVSNDLSPSMLQQGKQASAEDLTSQLLDRPSKDRMIKQLNTYVRNNDSIEVSRCIEQININFSHLLMDIMNEYNSNGLTPLCQASSLGFLNIVRQLLDNGADINKADQQQGWSPYMWAVNNGHDNVAAYLAQCGADTDMTSRTVLQYSVYNNDPLQSKSSKTQQNGDGFYHAANQFDLEAIDQDLSAVLGNNLMISTVHQNDQHSHDEGTQQYAPDSDDGDSSIVSSPGSKFDFTQCKSDQMIVIDQKQAETVVQIIFDQLPVPHVTRASLSTKLAPAIIMFLCARYAHYYQSYDLLELLLNGFVSRLRYQLGQGNNRKDLSFLSYWLANISQLLYYMRKDVELVQNSAELQACIAEVLELFYTTLIAEARSKIISIAVEAMTYPNVKVYSGPLERRKGGRSKQGSSESISSETRGGLFGRKRSQSSTDDGKKSQSTFGALFSSFKPAPPVSTSPKTLLTHLASVLFLMQQYHIHQVYQRQLLLQLIYALGAELINAFVDGRFVCSRSQAVLVRFNLNIIEEWVRSRVIVNDQKQQSQTSSSNGLKTSESSTTIDSLLRLINVGNIDQLLSPFLPTITACKLLQVASAAFSEEVMANEKEDNVLQGLSEINQSKDIPKVQNLVVDGVPLSNEQIRRLLFDNYMYEKQESQISMRILKKLNEVIDAEVRSSSGSLKLQTSNDLINFDAPAVDPRKKQKKRPILADSLDWLPFRLQPAFSCSSSNSSSSVASPDAINKNIPWGDQNEIQERRNQTQSALLKEKEDEWHFLQVKIEVQDKILALIK
ncbi:hypothetical protein MIR68_002181 [Amoeboaphelidium protococcarum]|nr:hypothetical protein MIR68_002181 [Amoeboaphelidium protococcarum]